MELLTENEKKCLLVVARTAVEAAVRKQPLPDLHMAQVSPRLQADGVSFVTITKQKRLRGCIGALQAYQPLILDVQEHAAAAATEDYRFHPVQENELNDLHIEVSVLTSPVLLEYADAQDLINKLRPGVDGVILQDESRRATFLPQVWEQLPEPSEFLSHLCQKMGASASLWKSHPLKVFIYQVEEFHEE